MSPKRLMKNRSVSTEVFDEEVIRLTKIIAKMVDEQQKQDKDPNEWLQLLYQTYASRYASDNDRIWSTGSIMIPLSLAGFAVLVGLDNPSWVDIAILMAGSTLLMFIWVVFAENYRSFQRKSEAVLVAIHQTIKLERLGLPPKLRENLLNRITTKWSIQAWRWIFLLLVCLAWCGVLALVLTGRFGT